MFGLAMSILHDGCPPEAGMHLCRMHEDDDGCSCTRCWEKYLLFVVNGRRWDPYLWDKIHEGGMIGA